MELNKHIVVKYSELHLKGGNKKQFIKVLIDNIKLRLEEQEIEARVLDGRDRVIIESAKQIEEIPNVLRQIVGISSFAFCYKLSANKEAIEKLLEDKLVKNANKTFRLSVKIVDPEPLGEKQKVIDWLAWFSTNVLQYKINLSNYDVDINIKVDKGLATIFFEKEDAIIGLPAGANGKALTLLSGGIDSPVAAFKTITRGINTSFITFLTPRTSDEKTIKKITMLANQVNKFNGKNGKLFLVNFEKVQEEIMKLENSSYRITLLRRYFMRFAKIISYKYKFKFVITGDSLGQVASQTPESMSVIDNATKQLIIRPLVSMSKNEIINLSKEIGTYDISIMEGDDMCSLFTPKAPIIHPKLKKAIELELMLENMDKVLREVLDKDTRVIELKGGKNV